MVAGAGGVVGVVAAGVVGVAGASTVLGGSGIAGVGSTTGVVPAGSAGLFASVVTGAELLSAVGEAG